MLKYMDLYKWMEEMKWMNNDYDWDSTGGVWENAIK